MTILRSTLLTLFLFVSVISSAQVINSSRDNPQKTVTKEKKIGSPKKMRILTNKQINHLKDGALLVRLQTKKNSINTLRKIGNDKLADKIETKQRTYNLKIVSAFRTNFNFCLVYFFFSDYSQNVRERQFDNVIFLTDSLVADSTIKFKKRHFLTAEFGRIEQDTTKYYSQNSSESVGNWSRERVENYYGSPNMGFGALIIKSDQFIQLRRPFPYYIRTFDSFPIKRKPKKTVKMMNEKLNKFYTKSNK